MASKTAKSELKNSEKIDVETLLPDELADPPASGFSDVSGLETQKDRIEKTVLEPLQNDVGISPVPLVHVGGTRGCGKTRFARAIAGELDVPDLSYWHAAPKQNLDHRTWEDLDTDEWMNYMEKLLHKAREESPSVLVVEQGQDILRSCFDELEEHVELAQENDEFILTVLTSRSPSWRFDTQTLSQNVYVEVPAPERDRWTEIFKKELEKARQPDDPQIALEEDDLDAAYEALGDIPPSDLGTVCHRLNMELKRADEIEEERTEVFQNAVEEIREELEENPLIGSLNRDSKKDDNRYYVEDTTATYDDVGGLDDVIDRIQQELFLPQEYPELFEDSQLSSTSGLLLHGPPGNGKTLLARALATETDRTFLSVRGPELHNKYFGETERMIRELFETAEENAPSIIFFDEFDAIAPSRENCTSCERGPVNMLLTEMDGLEERGDILMIAATNRPEDLDRAVQRPGRIGESIEITPPDEEARAEIFDVYLTDLPTEDDVTGEWAAEITSDGMTGAEVEAACRRAVHKTLEHHGSEGADGDAGPVAEPSIARADIRRAVQSLEKVHD